MFPIYRFKINGTDVRPKYASGLALEYTQESSQRFHRIGLSGSLTFTESDYDYIMSQDFDTEYIITIEELQADKSWSLVWTGSFYRTDCTTNIEDKKIEVKPNIKDQYNSILENMDKEFNLVELRPSIERVNLVKRPLIQIYVPGESVVSCFFGRLFWEQDCSIVENTPGSPYENPGLTKLGFAYNRTFRVRKLTIAGGPTPSVYVGGVYISRVAGTSVYTRADGKYRLSIVYADYEIVYVRDAVTNDVVASNYGVPEANRNMLYDLDGNLVATMDDSPIESHIYARVLADIDNIMGKQGVELDATDIVGNNRNYRYAIPYEGNPDGFEATLELSSEPTEWGVYQPGQYYVGPGPNYFPIARTGWTDVSFWFATTDEEDSYEVFGRKAYSIRDTYPLASAISVILREIAPGITHAASIEYSEFLYGDRMRDALKLMICQKTNLINGEYQQPAQKATIKLSDITDMLAKVFKCYWYIEDNKFKIEHVQFFDNGGSYNSSGFIDTSLLTLTSKKNTKAWGFKSSTYTFEKVNMPETYAFEWMDDVTKPFQSGIQVISGYVEKGKTEDVTISSFTTDVDYMLLNPGAISNDGFVLFGVDEDNTVPLLAITINGLKYNLQNGCLAFARLLPGYYLHDLSARRCKIDNVEYEALSTAKNKKQEDVKFPIGSAWLNTFGLYQTHVGLGQIEKATVDLDTKIVKATLKYPTE